MDVDIASDSFDTNLRPREFFGQSREDEDAEEEEDDKN